MASESNILIQKLDEFIRRYYKNQLIKGTIYSIGILLVTFFSVILFEYFGEFSSIVRGLMFFGTLFAGTLVLIKYIVIPAMRLYKIGSRISYNEASLIIGNHFSSVQDKLLNVLQLQSESHMTGSPELLVAGINQKIEQLTPVPFSSAVNISENRRYLIYVFPILCIVVAISVIWPNIVSKSTERLVHYQTYYEKEMPFRFQIQNKELKTIQTSDFKLELKIIGDQVPDEVHIRVKGIEYKLEKKDLSSFNYVFVNPQSNITFQLEAGEYFSKEYELQVLPKPSLSQLNVELVFPSYLNRASEKVPNTGDIQIPQGTKVNWIFSTKNTNHLILRFADTTLMPEQISEQQFGYSRKFIQNNNYTIKTVNQFVTAAPDSVNYSIQVIPDQFPGIEVSVKQDSLQPRRNYFSGTINDDYGFRDLGFHYHIFTSDTNGNQIEIEKNIPVPFSKAQISQPFFYFMDVSEFNLQSGDKIEYYFEVKDNDGVNGPKSTRSQIMLFKAPTYEEVKEMTEKNNEAIKNDLEESIQKTKQLQKDINELSKKVNDKKQLGYEEKKKIEDLIKKQNELQKKIEQIKQENLQNNQQQNEFSQSDESILEKQKQLEDLFDKVMTPEMKKLFDELNKMLEKLDKNQVKEKLEELKLSNKDIEKELDRNLEMFKQLEVQQKMQEAIDKLEELKNKEEALNKETEGKKQNDEPNKKPKDELNQKDQEQKSDSTNKDQGENKDKSNDTSKDTEKKSEQQNKKTDPKELEKKQEEINKEFENLKKDLKELEQKNKELEEPNKIPNNEEKQNEISKELQKSSQELSKNNKKNASKSQKEAADKMQEMQDEMEKAMEEEEAQQSEENAQALRQILENLVNLSFAQEELIKSLPKTRIDNPQYVNIPKEQNKLKDDSKIIEDSLLALSKRVPQISSMVNREISSIHLNMDKTVAALAERNTGESLMRMQGTMNSVNVLALLLNESLEQMQKQMQQQMKSKSQKTGKCKKPGSGSGKNPSSKGQPSQQSLRKMQEQLNKQLQDMKDAMEKGQKPGDKPGDKNGQKPGGGTGQNGKLGSGVPGNSEEFAKMAAQQEALRRQMQALMDKLKNKGSNPGGDATSLMEQTEKDLVNKQISNETMRRQQEILSRLLESEKAEREREQDEQRKSNEAKTQNLSNPEEFLEYKRQKEKEMELLNTVPPSFTPYYKEKVNTYFNNIKR